MWSFKRVRLVAVFLAAGVVLAGCESFDPEKITDMFGSAKKPLPGERKAVFPEGVPGVPQGVPPDLIKGNQPPPDANPPAVVTATPVQENPPEEKPKAQPKPKPKPKPKKTVRQSQPATQAEPAKSQSAPQPAPWPAPQQAQPVPWPSPAPSQ